MIPSWFALPGLEESNTNIALHRCASITIIDIAGTEYYRQLIFWIDLYSLVQAVKKALSIRHILILKSMGCQNTIHK